jgi:hypothetical protein
VFAPAGTWVYMKIRTADSATNRTKAHFTRAGREVAAGDVADERPRDENRQVGPGAHHSQAQLGLQVCRYPGGQWVVATLNTGNEQRRKKVVRPRRRPKIDPIEPRCWSRSLCCATIGASVTRLRR